jgi:hypothetical protein
MASREPLARRRKKRSLLAPLLLALALLLAWLFRGSFGLGKGQIGDAVSELISEVPVIAPSGDAQQAPGGDAGGRIMTECALELSSQGLRVDGQVADIDAAVAACRRAGKASLRVTGDARTGTYLELKRALEQAGVPLQEELWPERD